MFSASFVRNASGFLAGIIVAGLLLGQWAEKTIAPVLTISTDVAGYKPGDPTPPQIYNVERIGRRLTWSRRFCKEREAKLASTSFIFHYANQKSGAPIAVENESAKRAVGSVSYPIGCYAIDYSAMLPIDAMAGATIIGRLWYDSFHPFWSIPADFGTVTVPDPVGK